MMLQLCLKEILCLKRVISDKNIHHERIVVKNVHMSTFGQGPADTIPHSCRPSSYAGKECGECSINTTNAICESNTSSQVTANDQTYVLNIFVKCFGGGTISLDVHPNETIDDIKHKIGHKTDIPSQLQNIYVGIRRIENGRTLSHYNIQQHTTLWMAGILRGGMPTNTYQEQQNKTNQIVKLRRLIARGPSNSMDYSQAVLQAMEAYYTDTLKLSKWHPNQSLITFDAAKKKKNKLAEGFKKKLNSFIGAPVFVDIPSCTH